MSNSGDLAKIVEVGLPETIAMVLGGKSTIKMWREDFFLFSKLAKYINTYINNNSVFLVVFRGINMITVAKTVLHYFKQMIF